MKQLKVVLVLVFFILYCCAQEERFFNRFRNPPNQSPRPQPKPRPRPRPSRRPVPSSVLPPHEEEECTPLPECPSQPEKFYTADGSCNNPLDGSIGQVGRPHKRLVPAEYSDGRDEPRKAASGKPLPSAREVSTKFQDMKVPKSTKHTHILVLFGQFIAHDTTLTPTIEEECAECDSKEENCFNIPIPRGDAISGQENRRCLPIRRSEGLERPICNSTSSSVREQFNVLTPFIDGGTLYGNSEFMFEELLDGTSNIGQLKTGDLDGFGSSPPNAPSLPVETQVAFPLPEDECPLNVHKPVGVPCFVAGDVRVNENTALASFHTLFLRFHNKLVKELQQINPRWTRQEIIDNARLIVSAINQRITYKEFLPEVLGADFMRSFGLELIEEGYWNGYDASFDATTSNSFATAAMRFGHTLLTSSLTRPAPFFNRPQGEALRLKNSFSNSIPLLTTDNGGANSILRGLTRDAAETADTTFVEDIRDFLFLPRESDVGQDLLARNIQRGRDHGLPGYNIYREFCGLNRAKVFADYSDFLPINIERMARVYKHVDDVDLYIAGLGQLPRGGLFGATFSCILGYQFRDIRKGDRLWHENGGELTVFTPAQLQAIRQFSLARLLCELDDMEEIQPNPFQQVTVSGNGRRDCRTYPRLNLGPWRDPITSPPTKGTTPELTVWFPTVYRNEEFTTAQQLLNFLLQSRPDDVCEAILGVEQRTVRGNIQYRFSCPPGTIKGTDYPNVDASKGAWTRFVDVSTPTNTNGDDDESRNSPPRSCVHPLAIQVFNGNTPARRTGNVFSTFSLSAGFVCRGNDQPTGRCLDYKVRYFCKRVRRVPPVRAPSPRIQRQVTKLCKSFGVCCA